MNDHGRTRIFFAQKGGHGIVLHGMIFSMWICMNVVNTMQGCGISIAD